MRIIAGSAGGIKLKAPKGNAVRPTADRVREALFSMIATRVVDSIFLDLYAGTGAVGIEALSRGAERCCFVEHKASNLAVIKANLTKTGLSDKADLVLSTVEKFLRRTDLLNLKADLIYMDPPYDLTDPSPVIDALLAGPIFIDNALLIVEHASANRLWAGKYRVVKQKKYGDTSLTMITP